MGLTRGMRWGHAERNGVDAVREDMREAGVEKDDNGNREKWRARTHSQGPK